MIFLEKKACESVTSWLLRGAKDCFIVASRLMGSLLRARLSVFNMTNRSPTPAEPPAAGGDGQGVTATVVQWDLGECSEG